MMQRKSCFVCGRVKPLTDFLRRPDSADGRNNRCKECHRALGAANRAAKITYYRGYDRNRGNLPHRVAAAKAYQQTEHGKERHNSGNEAWKKRHPEKRAAQGVVSNAIRHNRLIRGPCEKCGAEKTQAHHDDYDKPLEVRWLCYPCHMAHHKAEREASR